jgi:peptidoglycan/LPS O-acetylase OafA/YrhL
MVLTFHTVVYGGGGGMLAPLTSRLWLGVPLFFLLSGFLLFRPMAHAAIFLEERPSFARYARSRVLRIVPAYWVALTVTIIHFYHPLLPVAIGGFALLFLFRYLWTRRGLLVGLALAAIALVELRTTSPGWLRIGFLNYSLLFLLQRQNGIIGPAWTLCIEAAFYAFLPLFVLAADRWARRGPTVRDRASRLAVLLACLLPVGNVYLTYSGDARPLPTWLPGYIDEFAIGMLLAVAVEVWPRISRRRSRELLCLGLGLGVLVNVGAFHLGAPSPYGAGSGGLFAPGMEAAFALVLASTLLRGEQTVVGRALSWRPLVAAGTVSYGIYLWHMFVILCLLHTRAWWSTETDIVLVLAATSLIASVSWFLVERPAMRLKDGPLLAPRRPHRPSAAPAPATGHD